MEENQNDLLPSAITDEQAKNIVFNSGKQCNGGVVGGLNFVCGESGLYPSSDMPRAVCYPSFAKLACGFDPSLMREAGAAVGEQCRAVGADVLYVDPNVKNTPFCARNYKLLSEDPLLNAELANAYISGVQSQGAEVCLDGFVAYGREYGSLLYDSVADVRALNEIYLAPYRRILRKTDVKFVRCAPNRVNGEYCCHNASLLGVLREKLRFNGVIMSSEDGYCNASTAISAGTDAVRDNCGRNYDPTADGDIDSQAVARSARRISETCGSVVKSERRGVDWEYQHEQSCKMSAECTVLAKNTCRLLPFSKADSVAVVGYLAQEPVIQGGKVKPFRQDSIVSALKDGKYDYAYAPGYKRDGSADEQSIEQARIVAEQRSKVILVVGAYRGASEQADGWYLPEGQLKVIQAVTDANPNVAVVLQCNSPLDVSWAQSCKALLIDYYGGEQSGKAIADVIFGNVCPAGRLAETWYDVLPPYLAATIASPDSLPHRESVYVGYRYALTAGADVAFPFGYGLTYNALDWQQPAINKTALSASGKFVVEVNITNNGSHTESEVVQVYARNLDGRDFYPVKNLVAFKKIKIKRGETKKAAITVSAEDFASFDVQQGEFCVNGGKYLITVGRNSADDKYSFTVFVDSANQTHNNIDIAECYRSPDKNFNPGQEQFATLWGVTDETKPTDAVFDERSALCDIRAVFVGKLLCNKLVKSRPDGVSERNALAMPLFAFVRGGFTPETLQLSLQMLNGPKRFATALKLCWKFFADSVRSLWRRIFKRDSSATIRRGNG